MVILRNGKNTQQRAVDKKMIDPVYWLISQALAEAEAKAKAEAEAKAKAEANAALLDKLNAETYQFWYNYEHDIDTTHSLVDIAQLVSNYAGSGLPVPKCLIEALYDTLEDLPTTVYPVPTTVYPVRRSSADSDAEYDAFLHNLLAASPAWI